MSDSDGFTLAELMVVVMLMAIIFAGMFSLQDVLLQQRGRVLRNIMVRDQADYARHVMLRDLAAATLLVSPQMAAGGVNDVAGWKNLDASNMYCNGADCWPCSASAPCAQPSGAALQNFTSLVNLGYGTQNAASSEWFRFCYANGQLYYYHGPGGAGGAYYPPSGASNLNRLACGAASGAGSMEVLAGNPATSTSVMPYPAGAATVFNVNPINSIQIAYSVVNTATLMSGTVDTAQADVATGVETLAPNQASTNLALGTW